MKFIIDVLKNGVHAYYNRTTQKSFLRPWTMSFTTGPPHLLTLVFCVKGMNWSWTVVALSRSFYTGWLQLRPGAVAVLRVGCLNSHCDHCRWVPLLLDHDLRCFKEQNHAGHTSLVALICSFVYPFTVNLDILIGSWKKKKRWSVHSIMHFYKWHVSDWSLGGVCHQVTHFLIGYLRNLSSFILEQIRIPGRSSVTLWLRIHQYFITEECNMFVFRSAMWNHITIVKCKHNLSIATFSGPSGPFEISEPDFFRMGLGTRMNLSIARLKL